MESFSHLILFGKSSNKSLFFPKPRTIPSNCFLYWFSFLSSKFGFKTILFVFLFFLRAPNIFFPNLLEFISAFKNSEIISSSEIFLKVFTLSHIHQYFCCPFVSLFFYFKQMKSDCFHILSETVLGLVNGLSFHYCFK